MTRITNRLANSKKFNHVHTTTYISKKHLKDIALLFVIIAMFVTYIIVMGK